MLIFHTWYKNSISYLSWKKNEADYCIMSIYDKMKKSRYGLWKSSVFYVDAIGSNKRRKKDDFQYLNRLFSFYHVLNMMIEMFSVESKVLQYFKLFLHLFTWWCLLCFVKVQVLPKMYKCLVLAVIQLFQARSHLLSQKVSLILASLAFLKTSKLVLCHKFINSSWAFNINNFFCNCFALSLFFRR